MKSRESKESVSACTIHVAGGVNVHAGHKLDRGTGLESDNAGAWIVMLGRNNTS